MAPDWPLRKGDLPEWNGDRGIGEQNNMFAQEKYKFCRRQAFVPSVHFFGGRITAGDRFVGAP
ncbi:MAG: hypothetical protein C6W57_06340 [Caldibacillus debilis]|nr:MAG: hypothetical protein C6W57_06340 [Caldibacillus debilis]